MDEERDKQAPPIGVIDPRDPPTLRSGADVGTTAWRLLRRLGSRAVPGMRPFDLVSRLDSLLRRFDVGDAFRAATWGMENAAPEPVPLRLEPWLDEPDPEPIALRDHWGRRPPSQQTIPRTARPAAKAASLPAPGRPKAPGKMPSTSTAKEIPGPGVLLDGAAAVAHRGTARERAKVQQAPVKESPRARGPEGAAASDGTSRPPGGRPGTHSGTAGENAEVLRTPVKGSPRARGVEGVAASDGSSRLPGGGPGFRAGGAKVPGTDAEAVPVPSASAPTRRPPVPPEPATRRFMPGGESAVGPGSARTPAPSLAVPESATGSDDALRPGRDVASPGRGRRPQRPGRAAATRFSLLPSTLLRRVLLAFEGSTALDTGIPTRPERAATVRVLPDARLPLAAPNAASVGEPAPAQGKRQVGAGAAPGKAPPGPPPAAAPGPDSSRSGRRPSPIAPPGGAARTPRPSTTPAASPVPTPAPTPAPVTGRRRTAFVARTPAAAGSLTLSQFTAPTTGPDQGRPAVVRIGSDGTPVAATPASLVRRVSPNPAATARPAGKGHAPIGLPMALLSAGIGERPASRDVPWAASERPVGLATDSTRPSRMATRIAMEESARTSTAGPVGPGPRISLAPGDGPTAKAQATRSGRGNAAVPVPGIPDLDRTVLALPGGEPTGSREHVPIDSPPSPRRLPGQRAPRAWDPRSAAPEAMAGAIATPVGAARSRPLPRSPRESGDTRSAHRRNRATTRVETRRAPDADARLSPAGQGPLGQAGRGDFPAIGARWSTSSHLGRANLFAVGEPPAEGTRPWSPGFAGPRPGSAETVADLPTVLALDQNAFVLGIPAAAGPAAARSRTAMPGRHAARFAGDLAARFAPPKRDASQPFGRSARRPPAARDAAPGSRPTGSDALAGTFVAALRPATPFVEPGPAAMTVFSRRARGPGEPASAQRPRTVATPPRDAALPGLPQPTAVTWTFPAAGIDGAKPDSASLGPAGPTYREAWPLISTSLAAVSTTARLAPRTPGPPQSPAPESRQGEANEGGEAVDLDGLAEEMATRILRRLKREKERRGAHGW